MRVKGPDGSMIDIHYGSLKEYVESFRLTATISKDGIVLNKGCFCDLEERCNSSCISFKARVEKDGLAIKLLCLNETAFVLPERVILSDPTLYKRGPWKRCEKMRREREEIVLFPSKEEK